MSETMNKALLPLGSKTIVDHICSALEFAGIEEILVITGFHPENFENHFKENPLRSTRIHFIFNAIWEKGNGTSLWAAKNVLYESDAPFWVLMSDHIFAPEALLRLQEVQDQTSDSLLCTDASFDPDIDLDDATKVMIDSDGLIHRVDKDLTDYNAVDCGIFSLRRNVFGGLESSMEKGEYSLSGGVRYLAGNGLLRSVDISGITWQDIDTEADLKAAEKKIVRIREAYK